ncbi:Bug family tripartite tricarboxylate transporter substrate binding protein [Neisseria animalis]|uniref:Tripartite tricarboxylate transporter substrate binding protein n=1 Tax=Neisseria animalis TaxID=492 RepID=A0A5P3MQA3_NEIAN|nr:tripartite tricarboxylate transporter substrate binding protein [Neisseria animalis]QEY23753.1 tripartite tricarboxylate transporter substrate binding protein [Neisseria animalis]ROW32895.1 tripartite tricarboxylate transporter substrate binding protein [Neisseria animalis]VEE09631.1 Tripartite tricarboxylate transporter family receptor [Neisseria animalis]
MLHKSSTLLGAALMGVLALSGCNKGTTEVGEPKKPECIAPAKPGGGFDLTCKLAQSGLKDTGLLSKPMRVTYMPGGVGAVAYNKIVANDPANNDAIIAFSTGSLLNLAQGKFGKYTEKDVSWLAAVGTDYGMVAVNADSPLKNLQDLVDAMKKDPKSISFGAGGSVGGQDWMQTAMVAKAAGVNPRDMAYVALEGGGEVTTAVLGNHVSVISSGIAEASSHIESGKIRVLAVFAPDRLEGKFNDIPTAKEQGFDVEWPIIRGYYMGPKVSEESYQWWKTQFDTMLKDQKFAEIRANRDLLPFSMTGEELQQYVIKTTDEMRKLSQEFELNNQ